MSDSLTGGDCDYELGMQSKDIPDANITASSKLTSNHSPVLARLDGQGAWCSAPNDSSPYIQIQFGKKKSITKITTQGSFEELRWAMKYQIPDQVLQGRKMGYLSCKCKIVLVNKEEIRL